MGILDSLVKHFALQATINFKTKLSESAYHIQMQNEKIKDMVFYVDIFFE